MFVLTESLVPILSQFIEEEKSGKRQQMLQHFMLLMYKCMFSGVTEFKKKRQKGVHLISPKNSCSEKNMPKKDGFFCPPSFKAAR